MNKSRFSILLALSLPLVACSSSNTEPNHEAVALALRTTDVATVAGTWTFDIAASDVAAGVRERCAKRALGDAAAATSCWDEAATQAKKEKIRFSTPNNGRSLWRSFAVEGDHEVVFIEAPVDLTSDGPDRVLARLVGKPTGMGAGQAANAKLEVLRIEIVDPLTIATTDPKKGRLVFTKDGAP